MHSDGSDEGEVLALPGAENQLAEGLSEAMVRYAVRSEYALTVEDVLARRSRMLFLDAHLACGLAGKVADILVSEGVKDPKTVEFEALALQYQGVDSH